MPEGDIGKKRKGDSMWRRGVSQRRPKGRKLVKKRIYRALFQAATFKVQKKTKQTGGDVKETMIRRGTPGLVRGLEGRRASRGKK